MINNYTYNFKHTQLFCHLLPFIVGDTTIGENEQMTAIIPKGPKAFRAQH